MISASDRKRSTTTNQMTNLQTLDFFALFDALEVALKEVRTAGPEERTKLLALATEINDEINRRA